MLPYGGAARRSMNPLLFANLSKQRRLLESGSAYATERLVVNIVAAVLALTCVAYAGFLIMLVGRLLYSLPDGVILLERVGCVLLGAVGLGVTYVGWALMRALLDMADASIAISLGGGEQEPAPPPPAPRGRSGGDSWPKPPKPLIPTAEDVGAEDRKYMPGGR